MSILFTPLILPQGDCPGTPILRGDIIYWIDDTNFGSLIIQNTLGENLTDPAAIKSVVRGAISHASGKYWGVTWGKIRIEEGTEENHTVTISAKDLDPGYDGHGGIDYITIDTSPYWTSNVNLIGENSGGTYLQDIYSLVFHEMVHVFGLLNADNGSTVANWEPFVEKRNFTSCDSSTFLNVYYANSNITVQNDFGGGDIKIIKNSDTTTYSSPYTLAELPDTWPWKIEAFNQEYNGWRIFYKWTNDFGNINTTTNPYTIIHKYNDAYTANFTQQFSVTFQNSSGGGNIIVNGISKNSPYQTTVNEGDSITATRVSHSLDNITYYFTNWSTGSTNTTETFYPASDTTITAIFTPIAAQSINLYFDCEENVPIGLHWNEYPNVSVTHYQIWRRIKYKKQPTGAPVLLTTVSRGTTSYIDYDYFGTDLGFTDWMLWYDVRSYYAPAQTYPEPYWWQVFSDGLIPEKPDKLEENFSIVKENTLDNYPNPFNPTTIIQYQIKEGGFVSIKVYDYLGREVAVLVNKEQPSGKYSVTFDAKNLSSGVYFYTINANNFNKVKKMILLR